MKTSVLIITVFVIALIPVTAKSFGIWDVVVEYPAHHTSIENINGTLYYMSEPFELNSNYPKISFHDAWFTPPYTTTPPRYVYSDVTFFDETKETLRVIFTQPDFTDHEKPQAGLVAKSDGYHFLVSVNLEELSPLKQIESGLLLDEVQCKQDLILIQKHDGSPACVKPETKKKLFEYGWSHLCPSGRFSEQRSLCVTGSPGISTSEPEYFTIKELLLQNGIKYLQDKLVVTSGPTIRGDPGCGAVLDTDDVTHWFGIDSISEPKEIILYTENPQMCIVNTSSCFCNAQRELTALTLDELSYFTLQEEEKYAQILIDYLNKENINRTPKFQIGKFNLNYTDSTAIGYCGELWGTNTYDFFEGAFVNDIGVDYSIHKELSPLCAINDDSQWWERK